MDKEKFDSTLELLINDDTKRRQREEFCRLMQKR